MPTPCLARPPQASPGLTLPGMPLSAEQAKQRTSMPCLALPGRTPPRHTWPRQAVHCPALPRNAAHSLRMSGLPCFALPDHAAPKRAKPNLGVPRRGMLPTLPLIGRFPQPDFTRSLTFDVSSIELKPAQVSVMPRLCRRHQPRCNRQ